MKTTKMFVPGAVVLILLVTAFVGYAYFGNGNTVAATTDTGTGSNPTTPVTVPVTNTLPPVATASKYKDGTYSAVGTYRTPQSVESINVTVTLANDIVTNVSSTISASEPDSARYQNRFLSNYKALVIGKNINSLNLSQVSGSSLTSGGFNNAIGQIKTQALR